jgi:hypothetical protein
MPFLSKTSYTKGTEKLISHKAPPNLKIIKIQYLTIDLCLNLTIISRDLTKYNIESEVKKTPCRLY